MENILQAIEQEVTERTLSLEQEVTRLLKSNGKFREENDSLKSELKQLKKGDLFSKYAKNITSKNIESFCGFIFDKEDNDDQNTGVTTAPIDFYLTIKYWSNRKLLWKIFEMAEVRYNEAFLKTMEIPYEWKKEHLLLFVQKLGNQYVCNSAIFQGNLGFWHQEYRNRTVEANINSQYSNIPWQFVLKNPLWVKDSELFDLVIKTIKEKRSHSEYFCALSKYQELGNEQVEPFIEALMWSQTLGKYDSAARFTLGDLIKRLPMSSTKFDDLEKGGYIKGFNEQYIPERIKKARILNIEDKSERLSKAIKSELFSKEELVQFL